MGVETIASRFTWEAQGQTGTGIPPIAPTFALPWSLPGPEGAPLELSFELIRALLGPAFAIAMLGAIESLLCAVVPDGLTVLFDMVLAVAVGIGLAVALFIRRMALLTQAEQITSMDHPHVNGLPQEIAVYDVNGPLFFGAAEKAMASLRMIDPKIRIVILDMHDVPSMDGTAIVALQSLVKDMHRSGVALILSGLPSRIIVKLRQAGIRKTKGLLTYQSNINQARRVAAGWHSRLD